MKSKPNRHEFEQAARGFRAGRITLANFAELMFPATGDNDAQEENKSIDEATNQLKETPSRYLPLEQRGRADEVAGKDDVSRIEKSESVARSYATTDLIARIMNRKRESHKGDYGRLLLIGGSAPMPGAISLTGLAAMRSGAGLVVIATSSFSSSAVSAFSPCYMVEAFAGEYSKKDDFDIGRDILAGLEERREWASVIAIGPGLSQESHLQRMVTQLYANAPQPMVVDADALNHLHQAGTDLSRHNGARILTPHDGEFARLMSARDVTRAALEKSAIELANSANLTVVFKGHTTLVADWETEWRNDTGNPGMATGGSGDVLTGIISALIGQGLSPVEAAKAGVELHGLAGDLAAEKQGEVSMIATDIIEAIPESMSRITAGH